MPSSEFDMALVFPMVLIAYSKQTHQRLRNLGKAKKDSDNASTHTSECSICLMSIAVSPRVTAFPGYKLIHAAVSITIRCAMFACVALQVYSTYLERSNVAQLSMPELPCSDRFGGRRG
jgi:hypothetical protein